MRKLFTIFAAVLLTANVFAQSPEKMSYQAVIRDASDNLVTSQPVGMQISILQSSASGSEVYVETQTPTTNANGLVSIEIGTGTVVSGTFETVDWENGPFFIKSETDPTGGTNYTITGTSQLLSVPYALYAKKAGKSYSVGDFAQGGVVFYVDETGLHGLACAIVDLDNGSGIHWYNTSNTLTSAVGDGIYAGEMNTTLIVANQGATLTTYAAGLCASYNVEQDNITYGDWYLPSKYELNLMYINRNIINTIATANGGAAFASTGGTNYWSSTEDAIDRAWRHAFSNNVQTNSTKDNTYRVRAIRAF